jgi:hypothetical protein
MNHNHLKVTKPPHETTVVVAMSGGVDSLGGGGFAGGARLQLHRCDDAPLG